MNWKELKEFANSLGEKQLKKKVILWRENEAISDISANRLGEDQYIFEDEPHEGCFDESEALYQIKRNPDDYPNGINSFKRVYDKGTPILFENF